MPRPSVLFWERESARGVSPRWAEDVTETPPLLPESVLPIATPRIKASLALIGALCSFPRFPGDLLSRPSSLFLLSQQLLHPGPAVLEGKDADLPAQMAALGPPLAPHAGESGARPEFPPSCGSGASPGTRGRRRPFVLPVPTSRVSPKLEEPHTRCALSFPF